MDYATVKYEVTANGIAVITLNRPAQMNAVNEQMMADMVAACRAAQEDAAVKLVIVTGAGRGFSSGGDLDMIMNCKSPVHAKDVFDGFGALALAIYEIKKPVIAAVNGTVAGASMAPLMACDLILSTDQARFGFTFTSVGLCPDNGTSYFLVQKVGYHKAAEILWEGVIMSAQEAQALNLVNRILPADNFMDEVLAYAESLLQRPLLALEFTKTLLRGALKNDLYQQMDLENLYQVLAFSSPDFKEGVAAFMAKRSPTFNQSVRQPLLEK